MKAFANRHIGIDARDLTEMLAEIGVSSIDQLVDEIIPADIRKDTVESFAPALTEQEYLQMLSKVAAENKVFRSYIGQGYYGTITPSVILRNVFENPGWYTQYTPYQAEISQGRMEALLNFQTMVSDLTGLPIANASLLDEGTAASEGMTMLYESRNKKKRETKRNKILVDKGVYKHTLDVVISRAEPLEIEVLQGDWKTAELSEDFFAVLVQYPNAEGKVEDFRSFSEKLTSADIGLIVASDLLALTLLAPPGEWGADVVVGNSQRFGVPVGFGGPHAAFFATKEEFKRVIPGRIIGVSVDRTGKQALRMALQTREQHIKREKATSNICTAQALLAVMASMYAVYHGPEGVKAIAEQVHGLTHRLAQLLQGLGYELSHKEYFDTIRVALDNGSVQAVKSASEEREMNFFCDGDAIQVSLDETCTIADVHNIAGVFASVKQKELGSHEANHLSGHHPNSALARESEFLTHPVFLDYRSETEMMRYLKKLENRDLSLVHSMIPLGSCTMKLNAATQLMPVSWPAFNQMHPFAPESQTKGYQRILSELEEFLCEITGFTAASLMPNSGAQGELAGLLTIRAYHMDNGGKERNVALIPSSAHGTNPASAVMAGMQVVVVQCDEMGNIDVDDLREKAVQHREKLSSLMVTYPSTHGVYEKRIKEICSIVHENGGLVYMDGANMNAQVGLTSPGAIAADVCHLNLHKTFAIPHGGGGPGMGPICVNDKLAPYLPGHRYVKVGGDKAIPAVSSAPWGSASILLISYAYIKLLGKNGLREATIYAMLNANYLKSKLDDHFPILYTSSNGRVAHEFIVDLRDFKQLGISAEDLAKRLVDYGFHAPTLSFPVAGTFMIEPTESESKRELDRFCDAMISIKEEIEEVARGEAAADDNVIVNAPHTLEMLTDANWKRPYPREKAVFPLPYLYTEHKFWPPVARIDNAYGDRNLICTCPPVEEYADNPEVKA